MIAHSLEITTTDHLMRVRFSGPITAADLAAPQDEVQEFMSTCSNSHCNRVLFDTTAVDARLGAVEMFKAGEALAQAWHPSVRLAILSRPDQVHRDSFFENVLVNRQVDAKMFTDRATAEHWLGS